MKKSFAIPLLVLSLALVACGKKNNESADPGQPAVPVSSGASPVYTPLPSAPAGMDIQTFCSLNGGQYAGGMCTLVQNYQNNAWLSFTAGGLNTVPVYPGQKVTVSVTNNAKVYVGNTYMQSGSGTFAVNYAGGLLRFYKLGFYDVNSIQIRSCLIAPNQLTNCP